MSRALMRLATDETISAYSCRTPGSVERALAGLGLRDQLHFALVLIAVGIPGAYVAGLFGIGGGTFTVPFYRFYRYPLKRAIALASATGAFIGLGGAIGAIFAGWGIYGRPPPSLGYIGVTSFLIITPCMVIFAPIDSRSANALPEKSSNRVYVPFLAGMTLYMGYQGYADLVTPWTRRPTRRYTALSNADS